MIYYPQETPPKGGLSHENPEKACWTDDPGAGDLPAAGGGSPVHLSDSHVFKNECKNVSPL